MFNRKVVKMSNKNKKKDDNDRLLVNSISVDNSAVSVRGLKKSFKNITVLDGSDFDNTTVG